MLSFGGRFRFRIRFRLSLGLSFGFRGRLSRASFRLGLGHWFRYWFRYNWGGLGFIQTAFGATGFALFRESIHLFMAIFLFVGSSNYNLEGDSVATQIHNFVSLVPNLE